MQYSFLLNDFNKVFKDKKYIICVDKMKDYEVNLNSIKDVFESFKKDLFSELNHSSIELTRKDEEREENTKMMMK